MVNKRFEIGLVSLDLNGRVVMSDEVLDMIVASPDVVSSGANLDQCGGSLNIDCVNYDGCSGSWNLTCSNHQDCTGTLNGSCPRGTTDPGPGVP